MGPAQAQVIFKVDSPIKRHQPLMPQPQEALEFALPMVDEVDSSANPIPEQNAMVNSPKRDSLSGYGKRLSPPLNRPVNPKQSFLVTYMGSPLKSDTSSQSRYRLAPIEYTAADSSKRYRLDNRTLAPRRFVDQDSIMVAILEDSLRRIRQQLIPLGQTDKASAQSAFDLYRSIPSILPVRLRSYEDFRISSAYGLRVHPISGRLQNHAGIDLPQPRFTAVYATADGVVDRVVWQPAGMGLAVYIVHPSGYQTGYGHLEDHSVLVGEVVRRGQVIGRVGSTGLATGPHLHYTVLAGTQPVNPASYCFLLLNALDESKSSVSRSGRSSVYQRRK
ncbi:hypothetical protein GCM10028818_57690 [Spirosoma horti]